MTSAAEVPQSTITSTVNLSNLNFAKCCIQVAVSSAHVITFSRQACVGTNNQQPHHIRALVMCCSLHHTDACVYYHSSSTTCCLGFIRAHSHKSWSVQAGMVTCWCGAVQALDACCRSLTGPAAVEMVPGLTSLIRRGGWLGRSPGCQ